VAARQITGARATGAREVSLHRTVREGDRVRMDAVGTLRLAPGERVELAPGGLHLMLMGLEQMPAEGASLRLCLVEASGETCVDAPVRRAAPASGVHHSSHHGD
jgi:copper(I)-binding protein